MFKIEDKAKVQLPDPKSLTQHINNKNSQAHLNYHEYITEEDSKDADQEELPLGVHKLQANLRNEE